MKVKREGENEKRSKKVNRTEMVLELKLEPERRDSSRRRR